ncbi:MAG: hypothetical protein JXJ04_01820 [Spirochaetales bacterium]|nr:hypothetical protein [Spirochaetales bacterium]
MQQLHLSGYSIKKTQLDRIIKENMDLPIPLILKKIEQYKEERYNSPVRLRQ